MDKLKKDAMIQALEKSLGVVSTACRQAGVARSTHYNWLEDDPEYKAAVDELKNVALDFAESTLLQMISGVKVQDADGVVYKTQPNVTATIFFLKTQGKERGYVERTETNLNINEKDLPDWMTDDDFD